MEEKKAIRINMDGSLDHITFTVENEYDALVNGIGGGLLEAVYSQTGNTTFFMDEEGKFKFSENRAATRLLHWLNPVFKGHDYLAGPVVITGGADDEGYALSIHAEALNALGVEL